MILHLGSVGRYDVRLGEVKFKREVREVGFSNRKRQKLLTTSGHMQFHTDFSMNGYCLLSLWINGAVDSKLVTLFACEFGQYLHENSSPFSRISINAAS